MSTATPGHEVDVTVDGVPKYRIRVTEIFSENAKGEAQPPAKNL